jgi:chromosome partitioning protein
MIILIGGEKGGTGKTTTAINQVVVRARQGREVALVNCDKQESAAQWAAIRAKERFTPAIPCFSIYGDTVHENIRSLATKYEDIVIDAGGQDSAELRSAMLVADVIITPAKPSQFDVFTLSKMDKLVSLARSFNTTLKAAILTSIAPTHPGMTDVAEMAEFVESLPNYHLLKTVVRDRKAYRNCARDGKGAVEYDRGDEKAAAEMAALGEEIWA